MPRQKKQPKSPTLVRSLEELVQDYGRDKLVRALSVLETDISWQILRTALIREYGIKVNEVMDVAQKDGRQVETGFKTGVAQTLHDIALNIIPQYKKILANEALVTTVERPEEE